MALEEGAESILKNGLRPGIHYADPKNINKRLWKICKEAHDKNGFKKLICNILTIFH
jgi:ribulose bisphosphate carboxylase small subunit